MVVRLFISAINRHRIKLHFVIERDICCRTTALRPSEATRQYNC
jgi:hypothetical protein